MTLKQTFEMCWLLPSPWQQIGETLLVYAWLQIKVFFNQTWHEECSIMPRYDSKGMHVNENSQWKGLGQSRRKMWILWESHAKKKSRSILGAHRATPRSIGPVTVEYVPPVPKRKLQSWVKTPLCISFLHKRRWALCIKVYESVLNWFEFDGPMRRKLATTNAKHKISRQNVEEQNTPKRLDIVQKPVAYLWSTNWFWQLTSARLWLKKRLSLWL